MFNNLFYYDFLALGTFKCPFKELFVIYLTHHAFRYLCMHLHWKLLIFALLDLFFQDSLLKEDIRDVALKELSINGLSNCNELKLLDDLWKSLFVVFEHHRIQSKNMYCECAESRLAFFIFQKIRITYIYLLFLASFLLFISFISLAELLQPAVSLVGKDRGRKDTHSFPQNLLL